MTNEEVIEELKRIDTDLLKTADCGNKTSDSMAAGRGRKAVGLAIEAVENQERYRNALEIAVREMAALAKKVTGNDTPIEELVKDGVKRYEKKAGIEIR